MDIHTTPSFLFLVIFDPNSIESSSLRTISPSAYDPDPLDPQKYADPRIQIQGAKYQPKTAKKTVLLLNPKSELLKKRDIIKISTFLNGSLSFRIKTSEKNETKSLKIIFC